MDGEEDEVLETAQPVRDPGEPGLLDVRLAVNRRDDVRAAVVRNREARSGDRGEDPARVGHDVSDDVDPPEHAFLLERRLRAVVRAEEEPRDLVGLDPVPLLRHVEVAAP